MNKMIRKLRPSDYWRIGEHESWFSDMSAKGLYLKKMGLVFAFFEKKEPRKMQYRIDVSSTRDITTEQKEIYAENGWEYITNYGVFHVFASPEERNAPELHTDPAEQSYTLEELDKKLKSNIGMIAVSTLIMFWLLAAVWFYGGTPLLNLVIGSTIQQIVISTTIVYNLYSSWRAAISIHALRKTLLEGKPINHEASWKNQHKIKVILLGVFLLLITFGSIIPWVQLAVKKTNNLPIDPMDLPIVRLADIEQNPDLIRVHSYDYPGKEDIDWNNKYTYEWSPLAPVQYESNERGVVPSEMWKDNSGEYSPSITSKVYLLLFPAMSEEFLRDLAKKYEFRRGDRDYRIIEDGRFDLLFVREGKSDKEVYASKRNVVMYIRYYGYADTDILIREVNQKIDAALDQKE